MGMNEEVFSDIEIEKAAAQQFGCKLEIKNVIARDIPCGIKSTATLFITIKNQLYVYINGETPLLLADVIKMIYRMGLVAEEYLPPKSDPDYFERIGRQEFIEVFPSRRPTATDDLTYYRTLALYNPALVRVNRIKNGQIFGYDVNSGAWSKAAEFAYSKLSLSADHS